MMYFERGSKTDIITADDTRAILKQVFDAMGPKKRVLALPPDFTRFNSYAGEITEITATPSPTSCPPSVPTAP